ncbi:hypothetical protein PLANPX_2996 [Lacipirellula parvula]|uniref:Uncharacterized protein n=1 Tax=Lacipirellula parvula TaxID=2650471 RepID=A0A5K7X9F3_9BACT|nr:hypothetical protein PLANPX_2996 [Lacipirellula parvula]
MSSGICERGGIAYVLTTIDRNGQACQTGFSAAFKEREATNTPSTTSKQLSVRFSRDDFEG